MHGSQVARQRPVKAKTAGSNPVRAAKSGVDKLVKSPYRGGAHWPGSLQVRILSPQKILDK